MWSGGPGGSLVLWLQLVAVVQRPENTLHFRYWRSWPVEGYWGFWHGCTGLLFPRLKMACGDCADDPSPPWWWRCLIVLKLIGDMLATVARGYEWFGGHCWLDGAFDRLGCSFRYRQHRYSADGDASVAVVGCWFGSRKLENNRQQGWRSLTSTIWSNQLWVLFLRLLLVHWKGRSGLLAYFPGVLTKWAMVLLLTFVYTSILPSLFFFFFFFFYN